ncbi:MAG: hypothetical protein MUO23_12435 [Anaerolineales bacterium]|nr:hypothetical protein [Anaerolineales bacterium]
MTTSLVGATLAAILTRPLAYLDPGSGSYLLQLLVAVILGAALALRVYWGRIKSLFTRKPGDDPADKPDEQ